LPKISLPLQFASVLLAVWFVFVLSPPQPFGWGFFIAIDFQGFVQHLKQLRNFLKNKLEKTCTIQKPAVSLY
jgi:hypothetical protein